MTTQHQMVLPKDLKYSKEHTWVRVNGDRATVGITDFAQSWIGNLLSIDLFEEDSKIEQWGLFGTLETSKVSFELYSPISGTIIKRNNQLAEKITLINKEPYEGGWMIVLSMKDVQDLVTLMDVDAYKEYLKNWADAEGSNE
jgi:glycine cleavage system H protein